MNESSKNISRHIKQTRFPTSLFFVLFIVLLLMSGIHTGLVVLITRFEVNVVLQTTFPMIYWAIVATGLTLYTRWRIKKTYDEPMRVLAAASARVASGDFSVYLPPYHTGDRHDYLDVMLMDFNKMVEELGSIETLKTDFFSNVSHEIQTPIAVIQNYAEMLRLGNLSKEQVVEYSESIMQASKKLSSLITNMLKLNKLEKQTIKPICEGYDLCRQLVCCALQFEDLWEQKNIEFVADIEEHVEIFADQELMELVFSNLLSNAIKFTESGGTVTLRQISTIDSVIVEVSDTGCGMSKETSSHIFDKFYQGDTSHATEGNGLGLSLSLRILELMDASISIISTLDKGSTFSVTIPKRRDIINE